MVFKFLPNKYDVSRSFFEKTTTSKSCLKAVIKLCSGSLKCTMYIHGRLSEQSSGPWAAFGVTFRVTGGYQKAETSFRLKDTGGIFRIGKCLQEASKNYKFNFFHNKALQKF
jgi:hypothetical protein